MSTLARAVYIDGEITFSGSNDYWEARREGLVIATASPWEAYEYEDSTTDSETVWVRPITVMGRTWWLERERDTIDLTENDIIVAQATDMPDAPAQGMRCARITSHGLTYEVRLPGVFTRRWRVIHDGAVVARLLHKKWPRCVVTASTGVHLEALLLSHSLGSVWITKEQVRW